MFRIIINRIFIGHLRQFWYTILSMKRFFLITLITALVLAAIFFIFTLVKGQTKGKGALQITANVKSTVTLDGVSIGSTPLCKCKEDDTLKEGEYLVGITPEDRNFDSYTIKVKVVREVLTAVDRTFLPGSLASASVLTLEKSETEEPQLLVSSLPDGAIVTIDGNPEGVTPYHAKRITASEHEIEIQKKGYNKKTLRVRTVAQYKLLANVILGTASQSTETLIQPTPSTVVAPTTTVAPLTPSPSAKITITPSPTLSQKVTPIVTLKGQVVTIKETPTGFLRVRSGPGTSFEEVGRTNPGDVFKYLTEQNGWYQVELADKTKGWVSGTYATKSTN